MTPLANIAHHSSGRLRLRVCERRGDRSYFDTLSDKLATAFKACSVAVNPATGSVLLTGESIELQQIVDYGRKENLFAIDANNTALYPMGVSITAPLKTANRQLRQISGGRLDLPGTVFLALMVFGIIELIRGNWKMPPWYTAFWYAFGLYSKSLIDPSEDLGGLDPSGE
jgi:hypothetical protein